MLAGRAGAISAGTRKLRQNKLMEDKYRYTNEQIDIENKFVRKDNSRNYLSNKYSFKLIKKINLKR